MIRFHPGWGRLAAALVLCLCTAAFAAPSKAITYRGGGQGPVSFDHQLHANRGYVCKDCHTAYPATGKQLFQTRKQARISRADHDGDGQCFACHNGKVAGDDCEHCHR
jgi:c(7)-type cytochrome triheme protein